MSQNQINVDLSKSSPVKCENCENYTFVEVSLMFWLSALVSPTGQAGNVPVPTYACNACGHINDGFLPKFMRKDEKPKIETPTPSPISLKLEK